MVYRMVCHGCDWLSATVFRCPPTSRMPATAMKQMVVVDDGAQGVTHIVRGEDLADNTARQILLQHALKLPTPRYLHTPLVRDERGEKLSKQTRAPALPRDALPALLAVWRLLGQPLPEGTGLPASVPEFWSWAFAAWNPGRLPPTAMLPAPARFEGAASRKV